MAALNQFRNQAYHWHRSGHRRHCDTARVAVYRRQVDRFGCELVVRHIRQTSGVLDRAEDQARLKASQERNRGRPLAA